MRALGGHLEKYREPRMAFNAFIFLPSALSLFFDEICIISRPLPARLRHWCHPPNLLSIEKLSIITNFRLGHQLACVNHDGLESPSGVDLGFVSDTIHFVRPADIRPSSPWTGTAEQPVDME